METLSEKAIQILSNHALDMPNSFEEIGKKADRVRTIDLNTLLQHYGCTKDSQDKNKWHTPQGIISVTGHKFMNWTLGIGGGGAIDLAIHLQGLTFKDAVFWLCETFTSPCVPKISQNRYPAKQPLKLPQRDDKKLGLVRNYLRDNRRIPIELIEKLILSGKLYADIKGNAVFLLLGKKKRVVGAELRGTCRRKWRGIAQGSRKNLGCFYIVGKRSRKMVLCESAIDAVSCVVFYPEYTVISTSGATANPGWLKTFITNGCEIYCGFDTDRTGDMMADKMIKLHPSIKRLRPPGHDWNEAIQSYIL